MAFSGSIPHLVNGVSRQVDAMRLPTHLEEQINRLSTPSAGNQRRPSTDHIATLGGTFSGDYFYHPINRDASERYHVMINDGDVRVFDSLGASKVVDFPNGKAYLSAASPKSMFAVATSADYTFIVNKTKTVAVDDTVRSTNRGQEALIFVRAVNFSKQYRVKVNGTVVAEYITGDGADQDGVDKRKEEQVVTPVNIAKILMCGKLTTGTSNGWSITALGGGVSTAEFSGSSGPNADIITQLTLTLPPALWDMKRYANVIWIKRKDGASFSISSESDRDVGTDNIVVVKDMIQDFSDLPNHGPIGFVVKVAGNPTDGFDDYWVNLSKPDDDDTNDNVVWKECPKPNIPIAFDGATMPHVLVRNADGTFTFKQAPWGKRKVGEFADDPSFLGGKINDAVFSRARLGFLCNESIVMTRPGEFFDFWRTTMTAILDDDPIDVSGTSDNVAIFKHAVSFAEDLYLFADLSVHRLTSGDLLTPSRVALPVAASAQVNLTVPPVSTVKSILFLGSGKAYGDLREIFTAPDTNESINASISDHAPGYLPTTFDRVVASDTVNLAFCSSPGADSPAYVYQYFWSGSEKLQASWHKWSFPSGSEVLGSTFFDDELHLMIRNGTSVSLQKMSCAAYLYDPGKDWQIKLDRRALSTALPSVTGATNTTVTLPYAASGAKAFRWGGDSHGLAATVVSTSGNDIVVPNAELPVVFGVPFTSYLELSRIYMREASGDKQVMVQSSTLRIKRIWFHVDKTSDITAYVQPYTNGPVYSTNYTALRSNDAGFIPERVLLGRGKFSVPVKATNNRVRIWLSTSTHLPDSITGVEWEGEYDIRARRV